VTPGPRYPRWVRRLIAAVLVLAAAGCGGRAATGPAWPESAGTTVDPELVAEDGGESLEPREGSVAAVEASKKVEPPPVVAPPAAVTETKPDFTGEIPTPTPTPTPPATGEDPPIVEEIVIEISD
jgi:hypothetical protein